MRHGGPVAGGAAVNEPTESAVLCVTALAMIAGWLAETAPGAEVLYVARRIAGG